MSFRIKAERFEMLIVKTLPFSLIMQSEILNLFGGSVQMRLSYKLLPCCQLRQVVFYLLKIIRTSSKFLHEVFLQT